MPSDRYAKVKVDIYTRCCLTAIAVLMTLMVIGLWADWAGPINPAAAQDKFQDSGSKKAFLGGRWGTSSAEEKVAATQAVTNQKLEEIIAVLKSGDVNVQIAGGTTATDTGVNHAGSTPSP